MKRTTLGILALAAVGSLAACGSNDVSSTLSTPDDSSYSDSSVTMTDDLGQSICGAVGRGMTHGQALSILQSVNPDIRGAEMDSIIESAISAYCPQYTGTW